MGPVVEHLTSMQRPCVLSLEIGKGDLTKANLYSISRGFYVSYIKLLQSRLINDTQNGIQATFQSGMVVYNCNSSILAAKIGGSQV